jgi:hypothetical protein
MPSNFRSCWRAVLVSAAAAAHASIGPSGSSSSSSSSATSWRAVLQLCLAMLQEHVKHAGCVAYRLLNSLCPLLVLLPLMLLTESIL